MSGVVSRLTSAGSTTARIVLSGDTKISGMTLRQLASGRDFDRSWCPLHCASARTPAGSNAANEAAAIDSARNLMAFSEQGVRSTARSSLSPRPGSIPLHLIPLHLSTSLGVGGYLPFVLPDGPRKARNESRTPVR